MVTSGDGPWPTDEPASPRAADVTGRNGQAGRPGTDGQARLAALLEAYGAFGRPLRALVARLAAEYAAPRGGGPAGGGSRGADAAGRLVRAAGLPRRTVEEVLAALGGDVDDDPVAGPRIRPELAAGYRELVDAAGLAETGLAAARPADPLAGPLGAHADLVATMGELIAAAPRPRADLDHVAATAETVVRRALWLAATYDLAGRHLLCVGDHDLTSLAAAAVIPGLRVTVVDVDDELLSFLYGQERSRGLNVRPYFADLRFGLPPSVAGSADLAFTDPPYTPEGVALFCARGAEGLRDRDHGRVLLAYGFSDRTPTLGWKTQRALSDAGFALEAMLPAFHAYDGAEAVGARADLYVCRPTSHTWRHVNRAIGPLTAGTAIYSRGRASLESAPRDLLPEPAARALVTAALEGQRRCENALRSHLRRPLSPEALEAVTPRHRQPEGALPAEPPGQLVFVGEAPLPAETGGDRPVAHVRLATVLAQGLPPAARARRPVTVAADLTEDPGGWLPRLLLAVNADAVAMVVHSDHPAVAAAVRATMPLPGGRAPDASPLGPLGFLVLGQAAPKWRLLPPTRVGGTPDAHRLWVLSFAAVASTELDGPTDTWLRFLLDRAHGRIGNVWREALVGHVRDAHGTTLSKRDARAVIESVLPLRVHELLQARLLDLPLREIADVLDSVEWSWSPEGLAKLDLATGPRA
ncbi:MULTISPECIES: bis-aminopropyl spermidine synthase family protein [unclassified Pseudofrankia]|uniref:bis-aminopropyl spermidine synthase family protein n=1 Tax=unclassified Pseudofrankia TaxID=2994372 RepID=UPI0008DA97E7|nr:MULTISPECIES: bis-aminopropyl spermidine synthase family protein [unclassified Pseudofrankia]MDT3438158.1 bis-aminopropyl spermidine synthase family protein [Pseudofrankia sp. BMG5.37]OHV56854.1 hypothetical protein BCD48_07355 [Pseudofrankia sp. BMG5.36]